MRTVSGPMGQQDNVLRNNLIEEQCGRNLQFYEKGKDKPSSGFQKGDEIREEVHL
jgi:hypothetical protein